MNTTITTKIILVSASLLALSSINTVHADTGITVVASNQQSQYKGSSNDTVILPNIKFRPNYSGKASQGETVTKKGVSFGLAFSSHHGGFSSNTNSIFSGMDTRKPSLDLGLRTNIQTGIVPISIQATKDVISSKGFEGSVTIGGIQPTASKTFNIMPIGGIRYQDADVVDYYYGVRSSEATTTRTGYKGKAATTPFIGIQSEYNLGRHLSLNANLNYEKRANTILDSPLTDDKKYDTQANVGITLWF